ncbi:MAG: CDF family Co(II)/Ni(II) efflux transporter DmeF [Rhodospirillaceae bacterium]|nr:CDF family Co(II)/Ni(II) efflux transporter DmeF [Rhodospirillaceae bacterium]
MHTQSTAAWQHPHVFLGADHARNERRAWLVVGLTAAMMVGEIVAGIAFGSMALLADGVHMATHAGALAIAALAYLYARRHAQDGRFTFGTGKVGELAGFSSAIILGVIALMIGVESVVRLANPVAISFDEAIAVAVLGLAVNLVSAWVLHGGHPGHDHGHDHDHHHHHDHGDHDHGHHHHHEDHNLRSAYLHVLTDALTSVLAIAGLLAGRFYGWVWMDPMMGVVGGVVISRWAWGLMRGAGAVLLDTVPDGALVEDIRSRLEEDGDRIADLHLWRVGPGHMAAIVALVADRPQPPDAYKAKLGDLHQISHLTVEVHCCPDHAAEHAAA